MANDTIDTPAAQVDDPDVWVAGENGELIPNYDASFPTITEGEVVHGTVVRVDKDEVLVDIGYKSEGVIPVAELSIRRSVNPADEVNLGDEIDALVLTKEDAEGRLILSKKRARFELAWKNIERAAESGEPVDGRVIEVVKGGLILDLGVRGFLPASLVDIRRVQDLDEFLGKELRCKVIELNRSRNNVVLSRRAVLEDERKEQRQAILDRLSPGAVVEGTISNIVDFGAFVDLDGMDGLIHISELSWTHVNHPSEVLEIGQEVKVKVLDIDRDRQRISLGLKQTQSDPWQQVLESYNQGDVVEGRVTKVVTFGAFVEIMPGVEGLVHISELAEHHVENPREVVSQGDTVKVKIIEVDAERRRLSLSRKRVEEGAPVRTADGGGAPQLDLSEDVFGAGGGAAQDAIAPHGENDAPAAEDAAAEEAALSSATPEETAVAEPDEQTLEAAQPSVDEGEPMASVQPDEPEEPAEVEAPAPQAALEAADESPEPEELAEVEETPGPQAALEAADESPEPEAPPASPAEPESQPASQAAAAADDES
ncbi:MAG: 30S ribosomal protein S1 [Gaiellaceae bacterium]